MAKRHKKPTREHIGNILPPITLAAGFWRHVEKSCHDAPVGVCRDDVRRSGVGGKENGCRMNKWDEMSVYESIGRGDLL